LSLPRFGRRAYLTTDRERSARNGIAFQCFAAEDRAGSDRIRTEGEHAMNTPAIVSPHEREAAREKLLVDEKAMTRAREP